MTMFALKTDADAGFPPVLEISSLSALMLALLIARIGLSFDSKIGRVLSFSESGGVGGDRKGLEGFSLSCTVVSNCWCFCIYALQCLVLGPDPPAGNLASVHVTPNIPEKKSLIVELE